LKPRLKGFQAPLVKSFGAGSVVTLGATGLHMVPEIVLLKQHEHHGESIGRQFPEAEKKKSIRN
jgi:hypothetical protein